MTHSTYTQQAPSSFKLNQTLIADTPRRDERTLAQAELNHHLETQAEAVAPTQDPLTYSDRRIISEIIEVQPESVRTIWIEGGITVWVQLVGGSNSNFEKNQIKLSYLNRELVSNHHFLTDNYHPTLEIDRF
ncbi:hypothetical protein COO91_09270 (plasmid) [Nostoc flagelliforme CCNUN1]|uniref:Uncharacterized protein n=1 Tax=Nostoc flagelliforme CCNUN1 TaxID=2038116 RepID=A0A2K8T5Y6_9NOSO|nr:hypothetical protein [Nostoc flagelliforme]AUB43112.1 hypothetical protein COO91_09270 [Nostoc flagelliforme CCNUN1]